MRNSNKKDLKVETKDFTQYRWSGLLKNALATTAISGLACAALYWMLAPVMIRAKRVVQRVEADGTEGEDFEIIYCYPHELIPGDIVLNTYGKADDDESEVVAANS